ncbi:hypothetical protein M407DRAFT_23522 [Tulasnella calospora MUT 4182]|uniref:Uncharacterized protein n=1 Tax=Tulasnella calospora MUT 4182 TaxID=1051891 RepID=A0A0C3QAE6_9AGAM|nr:hypothetical protein M407DRAFT_23522 [Tulasnella calospora MUT 4182]
MCLFVDSSRTYLKNLLSELGDGLAEFRTDRGGRIGFSKEEDQLDPSSPPPAPVEHISVDDDSSDYPPCAPLLTPSSEELPENPWTTQTRKPAKPNVTQRAKLRARKATTNTTKSQPVTQKATQPTRAPKRDVKGKAKAESQVRPDTPPPLAESDPPASESPPPKAKRIRRSSKGKKKDETLPSTQDDSDAATPVPAAEPTTVIAHIEVRPAVTPQGNRSRRSSKANSQPENHRLASISFFSNASYNVIRQKLAECAQVLPVFISNDITWKFTSPASAPTQPLNNDISMEALRRQVEDRAAKGKDHVLLLVMGPTLSQSAATAIASTGGVPESNALLGGESSVSRLLTTDSSIMDAAKMVADHYPKGRCVEHPDLACANWENLHFELTNLRCKVWGNKIVLGKATINKPPLGSAHFKSTDVIRRKPPPTADMAQPPTSSQTASIQQPVSAPASMTMSGFQQSPSTVFPPAIPPLAPGYGHLMPMPHMGYPHSFYSPFPYHSLGGPSTQIPGYDWSTNYW